MEVRRNELIRARYVRGAFRGEGLWQIAAAGGRTKVTYRWRVRPAGLVPGVIAFVFNAPRYQSEIMQAGFEALAQHLADQVSEVAVA